MAVVAPRTTTLTEHKSDWHSSDPEHRSPNTLQGPSEQGSSLCGRVNGCMSKPSVHYPPLLTGSKIEVLLPDCTTSRVGSRVGTQIPSKSIDIKESRRRTGGDSRRRGKVECRETHESRGM